MGQVADGQMTPRRAAKNVGGKRREHFQQQATFPSHTCDEVWRNVPRGRRGRGDGDRDGWEKPASCG